MSYEREDNSDQVILLQRRILQCQLHGVPIPIQVVISRVNARLSKQSFKNVSYHSGGA